MTLGNSQPPLSLTPRLSSCPQKMDYIVRFLSELLHGWLQFVLGTKTPQRIRQLNTCGALDAYFRALGYFVAERGDKSEEGRRAKELYDRSCTLRDEIWK